MNRSKFPPSTIAAIKRMYAVKKQKHYTLDFIANKLGVTVMMVRYHGDPETQHRYHEASKRWREEHPDQWRRINARAVRKWNAKQRIDSSAESIRIKSCRAAAVDMTTRKTPKSARSAASRSHAPARSR